MGKFDGILLMSDFDGTIYCNANVSEENRRAIRYFQSEGGLFALASGRPPHWLKKWKEYFVTNTYSAMMNGALLCDSDGENFIFESPIVCDAKELARKAYTACPELKWLKFFTYESICDVRSIDEIDTADVKSPVFKLVMYAEAEISDEYKARLTELFEPEYIIRRSWINGIEIQNSGSGKGDAVYRLKSLLGERARTVVAVGDFENDTDMIRNADIGYAVGNATPSLKEVADRVTVPCAEHAIAKIIEELEAKL